MAQTYCTNCGALLGAGRRFYGSCGAHVHVLPPVETPGKPSNARRHSGWPFKPDRLDKAVGLIVGVAFVLAVLWFLIQFFLGFLSGLAGA